MKKTYDPFKLLVLFRILSWFAAGMVLFLLLGLVKGPRYQLDELPIGTWVGVFILLRFFIAVVGIMAEIRDRQGKEGK